MNETPTNDPPLALKAAVVVGVVTLIVGIVAAVYLRWIEGDETGPAFDVAYVRLTNVPGDAELQVTATWSEKERSRTENGARAGEGGLWAFQQAPPGQALTLTVWKLGDGTRVVFAQHAVTLHLKEEVHVRLPDE